MMMVITYNFLICILDPLNSSNNLGRSCFGFRQIQTEFDNALERAMNCLEDDTFFSMPQENITEGTVLEGSMGQIFSRQKKSKSILGTIFGTVHHDSKLLS